MFEIEYKGGNTVILATKKTTLVVDPKRSVFGQKDLSVKDAVELATEPRFVVAHPDTKISLEGPGEYEVGDFSIRGVSAQRHIDSPDDTLGTTVYRVEVGGIKIALLGNIAPKLNESQLEALGVVQILILPVGGNGYTLDATSAAAIVRQVEPRVVIPVHYADSSLKYEVPQDELDVFTKELGVSVEAGDKLKVKSSTSLPDVLTVFHVTRS